jgi:hypothetical protein
MKDTPPVKTEIITLHAACCYFLSQEQEPVLPSNTMTIWVHTYTHTHTYINCSVEDRTDNTKSGTEVGGGFQTAIFWTLSFQITDTVHV